MSAAEEPMHCAACGRLLDASEFEQGLARSGELATLNARREPDWRTVYFHTYQCRKETP